MAAARSDRRRKAAPEQLDLLGGGPAPAEHGRRRRPPAQAPEQVAEHVEPRRPVDGNPYVVIARISHAEREQLRQLARQHDLSTNEVLRWGLEAIGAIPSRMEPSTIHETG